MTNFQRLAIVRECFLWWMASQPQSEDCETATGSRSAPAISSESILIRDEFYCGRRFRSELHHAVWFIEEDQLKIYRSDDSLVCVLAGGEIDCLLAGKPDPNHAPTIMKMPHAGQPATDLDSDDSSRRAA